MSFECLRSSADHNNQKNNGRCRLAEFSNLRWLWPYLWDHKRLAVLGMIGMLSLSVFSLPIPYLIKIVIDNGIGGKNVKLLDQLIVVISIIQIAYVGISWGTNYCFNRFSADIVARLKKDLFHRILRLPLSFFNANQSGYILSRIGEVEVMGAFFSSSMANIIVSVLQFVLCIAILIKLSSSLAAITLCVLPLTFVYSKYFSKDIRRLSWQFFEKSGILSKNMQDSLSGAEIVKSFTAEEREVRKIHGYLDELRKVNIKRSLLVSLHSEGISLLGAGVGFLVLWMSGRKIVSGQFSIGSYYAFAAYLSRLFLPTQVLANMSLSLQPARIAMKRIGELMRMVTEEDADRPIKITSLSGRIELDQISFEYEPGKPVFTNACMNISPGEKVLVAGPNGSGKSTLMKLIMGFYRPQEGMVLVDGIPIDAISLSSLREKISVITQNAFLFSDSIRNNILYSLPDATIKALDDAVQLSGAKEFIQRMPRGMDTEIGERGVRLSGGERQKISIARAILRNSDLILFDEAATHLDEGSVKRLHELIKRQFAERTCIVVSHRVFELNMFDRMFRIENGRIYEYLSGDVIANEAT